MPPAGKSVYSVLGFLTGKPMSGYDIKRRIDGSITNFWNENYGQIYPVLKQLVELGWATREDDPDAGGRRRHLYTITEAGRHALQAWLAQPTGPPVHRYEHLLKLFFGGEVTPSVSIELIEEKRRQSSEELERYRSIENDIRAQAEGHPDAPYWLMTVRNGIFLREADIQWCDESLDLLRSMESNKSSHTLGARAD